MIPISSKKITVIIAHRGPGNHLKDTFLDLKYWFENIVVVGLESLKFSQIIQDHGGSWINNNSPHIGVLWTEGIRVHRSDWYILVQSTEYLSALLKESIVETINKKEVKPTFYSFEGKKFFLGQRLKYNLSWTHDPSSGLLFNQNNPFSYDKFFNSVKAIPIKGELTHFGERTLGQAIQNSIHRSDWLADQIYKESLYLSKRSLVFAAIKNSFKIFFTTWLIRKGIREGFEGLVFCFLDSAVVLLGNLRYWEKYIRSGRCIKDQRSFIKKILVIKVRGLGDAVLATPVLKNLKIDMPSVSISVLTFNFCKPLFENNPNVNQIYGLPDKPKVSELKKMKSILSANNFDLIINLHARNFSSKLTKNIKARWKISRSYFLREKFVDVMIGSDHASDKSSIERDLDCIRAIGLNPIEKQPELFVTREESQWANEYLIEQGIDRERKLIMIHPAVTQLYRHWGLERFIQLSQHLIDDCGHQVMAIFSNMEQSIADTIVERVAEIFLYVGPLRTSMALIQKADLMVDNDSGPSHISQALKVPTLVLVGPDYKNTYRDKEIYKNENYIFYKDVPCRDLFFSRCLPPDPCQNRICMDHSVEEVFRKVQELLNK